MPLIPWTILRHDGSTVTVWTALAHDHSGYYGALHSTPATSCAALRPGAGRPFGAEVRALFGAAA